MSSARQGGDGDKNRQLEHLASTLKDRSVLVLSSVTLAGIALVTAGWLAQGSTYVPLLLLQLGGSLVLLVPLALLGLMLEDRVRRAEDQIRETAVQLSTLTAVTRHQLAEANHRREDLFNKARRAPNQHDLHAILSDASDVGAIAAEGVRVTIPPTSLRLRFRLSERDINTQIEELDGTILAAFEWKAPEPVSVFTKHLVDNLRKLDRHSVSSTFDPGWSLQRLLEVVQAGIESRIGARSNDLGHLIEMPNNEWAVSEEGLFSLRRPYHISAQRIFDSHENWPDYMRTQTWADVAPFDEAYRLAKLLLRKAATGHTDPQARFR